MDNHLPHRLNHLVRICCLIFGWSAWLPVTCFSQSSEAVAQSGFAEKIYLQTDGKVYTNDKCIWFKAIVTRAADLVPTALSGLLHVELVGPDGQVIEKKLVKLNKGIGTGSFQLNREHAVGSYLLRAYTDWNRNFGPEFIFCTYLKVYSLSAGTDADPIGKVTLLQEPNSERRLIASLDPLQIDSMHRKELTLVLSFDDSQDTLWIRKGADEKYHLNVAVPEKIKLATLQLLTKNRISYSRTIALTEDQMDLQFFPEGGELVHGLRSKVAFKALDVNGKGKAVSGEIVDSGGEIIAPFKSNSLGMGSFLLIAPDSAKRYYARLAVRPPDQAALLIPLPAVVRQGNALTVYNAAGEIRIRIASTYLKNDTIRLKIACRGVPYFEIANRMKEGALLYAVKADDLPEGILAITVADQYFNPLAERLYFNVLQKRRLQLKLETDKEIYTFREETKLNLEVKNSRGEQQKASLSVLVINKNQMGALQQHRDNILSHLLLSSDLKGEIEEPTSYFKDSINGFYNLDLLMLTQGWRKYVYTQSPPQIVWQPEFGLSVKGVVSGVFSRKRGKISNLTLLTFGKKRSIQTTTSDSTGRFRFYLEDEYGQRVNILLQSGNGKGENKNYNITLDNPQSPPIHFDRAKSIGRVDSLANNLVEKNRQRKLVDESYRLSAGEILLGEVVVEAYRMSPERQKVMEQYGKPKDIIEGQAILEKEQKWSYGLYSVLMSSFPGKVFIRRSSDGNLYARVRPNEMTLVVIDGMPVKYWDYPFIPNIPPGEVKSFELIENARNFAALYLDTYPQANPQCIPSWGDVIAIYTHGGKGIYGTRPPVGIMKGAVPVFSVATAFYQPKYINLKPEDWYKPDLRALIHWEPELEADDKGKATTSFYNADLQGEMMVVVEAISPQGEIGYCELNYTVNPK